MELKIFKEWNDGNIKTAVFDFDGTISLLRSGWEEVMEKYMYSAITDSTENEILKAELKNYIQESAGIQTIFQMEWLTDQVKKYGEKPVLDKWEYKDGYNENLMHSVKKKLERIKSGELKSSDYRVPGSLEFIKALNEKGVKLYIASGTDHEDVVKELAALEMEKYFGSVKGAPRRKAECPKTALLNYLIEDEAANPKEMLVVGDGKVEIALGNQKGTLTLGTPTNEKNLRSIDERKLQRLIKAGAHAITGNFENYEEIMKWLKF